MDILHGMLKTLSSEQNTKSAASETRVAPNHLDVFKEFLAHLDRATRPPTPRPRAKPQRKPARAAKR